MDGMSNETMASLVHGEALARSAVYHALALAFGPVCDDVTRTVCGPDGSAAVAEALRAAGAGRAAVQATTLRDVSASEQRHTALFGHTVRSAVPPYETEYGDDTLVQQPRELSDIAGFLAAFGLHVPPDRHERVDHISCECDFMSFLSRKEAYALEQGDDDMLEATRNAERLFLRDHLGRFAPAFGARLRRADAAGFYGSMGALLGGFVESECSRLEIPTGNDGLGLRSPSSDDAVPASCGGCELAGEER
jgi:DMSO reductase family type II enzyme chaperone